MTEVNKKLPFFTNQAVKYFGFFMVIFYMVIGFLFLFSNDFFPELDRTAKRIFGMILLIYGLFRAYRAIKSLKHENP